MKLKKSATFAVAATAMLWAGAALADTLLYTTYHSGGSTQVWVSSSGSVYTKSCNAAGACTSNDTRKEQ